VRRIAFVLSLTLPLGSLVNADTHSDAGLLTGETHEVQQVGGINVWEIGKSPSEIIAGRIVSGVARAAIKTGTNAYKNHRQSTRAKQANRVAMQRNQQRTASAGMVAGRQLVDQIRLQDFPALANQFSITQIYQRSLSGLVVDADKRSALLSRYDSKTAIETVDGLELSSSLKYLLSGIDPSSIRLSSVRKTSAKTATATLQMNHAGLTSRASVSLAEMPDGSWSAIDMQIPSKHLSLVELVQYRLIESLPGDHELAEAVAPGRLSQSNDVTLVLSLDPNETAEFAAIWNDLSEHARTWPLSQFLYQRAAIKNATELTRQTPGTQPNPGVIRSDSRHWLKAASNPRTTRRR
jgi:hypothetical protein